MFLLWPITKSCAGFTFTASTMRIATGNMGVKRPTLGVDIEKRFKVIGNHLPHVQGKISLLVFKGIHTVGLGVTLANERGGIAVIAE